MVTSTWGINGCAHEVQQELTGCHGVKDVKPPPTVVYIYLLVLVGDWYRFFGAIRMNPNTITFVTTKVGMFSNYSRK